MPASEMHAKLTLSLDRRIAELAQYTFEVWKRAAPAGGEAR
jgi:hypothetical protein